jgi:hypothetical protein
MVKRERTKVWYNEAQHHTEMRNAHGVTLVFKDAAASLEAILESPIKDYAAFKNDVLGYAIAQIKIKFSKAFGLGLSLDQTLSMLSIDLRKIETADGVLKTTPYLITVSESGEAAADDDQERFTYYAESEDQHNRLDFANELCNILERAHHYKPGTGIANLTNGLNHIVIFDPQKEGLMPRPYFVLEGIE